MKPILVAALLSLAAVTTLPAQTNNYTPPGLTGLGDTVLSYFTAFNTNLDTTFKDNRFDIWTGASSIQGGINPLVNDIGGSYDLWRPTPATSATTITAVSGEFIARNSGVAGTLVSAQGGLGFSVIVHDAKATLYLDGGSYLAGQWTRENLYGEVGFRVKKALGAHFYAGVGIGVQFPRNAQVLSALGGATF